MTRLLCLVVGAAGAVNVLAVCLQAAAGDTGLLDAVKRRDVAAVHALLGARPDVNLRDGEGATALHWAVRGDDAAIAAALIRAGANPSASTRLGVSPLSLAATNGSEALVRLLLEAGADPNDTLAGGETVLMTAARTGQPAAVEVLLKAGANPNASESWRGETALMWAAAENHADVVRRLVAHGARVDQPSRALTFPAVRYNLATHGTLPPPQGGFTALMFAARQGSAEAARALLDAGADPNVRDPDGTTALTVAVVNVHQDVAALLVEHRADPNIADATGMTPLYAAVELHTTEMYAERKPLRHSSDRLATIDLIRLLLAKGARPDAPLTGVTLRWGRRRGPGDGALTDGATPLMRAARLADVAAMRVLLDAGADLGTRQKDRTSVLMLAAGAGWRTGETILGGTDYGPESDAVDAVRLCLERGADVNDADEDGVTVLHHAIPRGSDVVQLLVDHGARVDVKDKHGRTPLDVARGVRAPGEATRMKTSPLRERSAELLRRLTSETTTARP